MPPFTKLDTEPALVAQGRTRYAFDPVPDGPPFVVEVVAVEDALAAAEGAIVLEVKAWEVDALGEPVVVDGAPVEAPARRCTISVDALADPSVALTVDGEIARETAAAADRLHRVRAARAALALLPKRQTPAPLSPPSLQE